jgi:hypothetical protein
VAGRQSGGRWNAANARVASPLAWPPSPHTHTGFSHDLARSVVAGVCGYGLGQRRFAHRSTKAEKWRDHQHDPADQSGDGNGDDRPHHQPCGRSDQAGVGEKHGSSVRERGPGQDVTNVRVGLEDPPNWVVVKGSPLYDRTTLRAPGITRRPTVKPLCRHRS